jgi:5-(carboxyamino)imidazole ribonucleotide synthase
MQPGVMINLLGEKGFEGPAIYRNLEVAMAIPGVKTHIYGKARTKSFRKMGHVTITGNDLHSVKQKAKVIKNIIRVIS